jgi:hypothetical protein
MSQSNNARLIYDYLVDKVLPTKRVVTYGEVSRTTGVPLGENGGAVRVALYEIFQECDSQQLPPLTSIVVQEDNLYDTKRRHGMPGGGYLVAEAKSPNHANRRRDSGWSDWESTPRPPDTDSWQMRAMIEAHQDSVWNFTGSWPNQL